MINTEGTPVYTEQEKAYWKSLAREYEAHLADMAKKHPTAAMLGVKTCVRCGQCCYTYVCIPRPEELPAVADYLHISVSELISKYMVADTEDCRTFFLRWAKHGEEDITGGRIPPIRTYDHGYCIFFDEKAGSCLIHPVRPQEARYVKCWKTGNGRDRTKWGMSGWTKDDIYRFIPDFDTHLPQGIGADK
ncbi:YkgJ family cysteine cluster protein [Dehalococcoides mccartyi]|uniref:YkgJ family cysteine cluster protein n=1 Tax=Dehalococcoides mccartyi TaxID=61435 RepID=UPI000870D294|nr:YkgJ family cysteine cluster protein [Dehalococcoides mccartyi]AOV99957.1 hypothetical protein DCWBC2_1348 [Dehalococcoides mccartyi]